MQRTLEISWKPCDMSPKITKIIFKGKLDAKYVDKIQNIVNEILDTREYPYIIMDFSYVNFISSPALGELMGCKKRAQLQNGDIVFCNLLSELEKKLRLMGAHKVFDFFITERDAIHKFNWKYENKPEVLTVRFPSNLDYVPGMRVLVSEIARIRGFDKKDAYRIETIVDEICNNAIEHGGTGEGTSITLRCSVDSEKIDLIIRDSGASGEKVEGLKKALENVSTDPSLNVSIRGRGLPIVAMLADKLEVNSTPEGTKVHVTKFRD